MLRLRLLALLLLFPSAARASTKASYMHYLKAVLHSHQGNPAEALSEYEAALELDPQSVFMYQQAVDLALDIGQNDRALALAERFRDASPRDPLAFHLLGNAHWARGEYLKAKESFEEALKLKPDFKESLLALGNLLGAQSPEAARKYLKDYLKQNPENAAEAEYQLALIEQKAGDLKAAEAHMKRASRLEPDNPQPLFGLAQIYEAAKDTAAALGTYQEILERDPRNVGMLNHVGQALAAQGDAEGAKERFLKAKAVAPDNPTTCLWLALLAEQAEDYDAAIRNLKDSAELKSDPSLNLRLSYYLTQAERLKEAVAVLEAAHAKWPQIEDLTYFLALGYDDLKMSAKAAQAFREVLKTQPEHRDARFQLGALYEKSGDMRSAEEQFREILKTRPDDASVLNYLGYSLADRGLKLEEAEKMIARAVELDPDNGAFLDSLGWVHFKLGRVSEARRELEAASRLIPGDDTLWEHLGDVYAAAGDEARAWTAWKTSLADSPRPAVADKAARAEKSFSAEELGAMYMSLFELQRGSWTSFGGPCLIEGSLLGAQFRFQGIVQFRSPWDLDIEVLGPLFTPLFRVSLKGEDGFEMDPLRLEGVDPELLSRSFNDALRFLRSYFNGDMFAARPAPMPSQREPGTAVLPDSTPHPAPTPSPREPGTAVLPDSTPRPARLRRGWVKRWVEAGDTRLFIDKDDPRLRSVKDERQGYRLILEDYRAASGRWVPAGIRVEGRGFALGLHFSEPGVKFR